MNQNQTIEYSIIDDYYQPSEKGTRPPAAYRSIDQSINQSINQLVAAVTIVLVT